MIVEKPDVFKQWMADILEHMSDAQPSKLARYVLALVRKASSEEHLRASVLDQLDVFLHERAAQFADQLVAALASGSYTARPPEGRLVTLPVAPPPRRQVHLPPQQTLCSASDGPAGGGHGAGSPARLDADGVASSRSSRSRSRSRSPVGAVDSNGRSAPRASDAVPVTDLRQRLGGVLGRRRCRDFDERGACPRTDGCPLEHGWQRTILSSDSSPPPAVLAPFSQPQSPPAAAIAEPYRPDAPGLTDFSPALVRSSLPAGAAASASASPARTVSTDQGDVASLDTCSLHLRGIPAHLNQIMPLNEHLSQFGRIVNIEVSFGGDSAAALVTFDRPEEAEAALSSTEPVLGCRHITAHPHTERPTTNGRQMALSGLKRTVANPEAARWTSDQDLTAVQRQSNGDTAVAAAAAAATAAVNQIPAASAPEPQLDPAGQQRTAAAAAAVWQQQQPPARLASDEQEVAASQQSAEARRQGVQEIRRAQDLLAANIALDAKRKEKQQAARRLATELQRREADLLQRQLEQQRHLLARLDSAGLRPAERQTLLAALRALQAASLSTRAGLAAALQRDTQPQPAAGSTRGRALRGALRRPHPADGREAALTDQPAAKLPAGLAQETEREVLDLELALYQRQLAGSETEELQQRLARLRQAAVPSRGRGRDARSRGGGRGWQGRGRGGHRPPGGLSSIDRRPATLVVSDIAAAGPAATVHHLTSRFGEVTDWRPVGDTGALAVTFGSRRQAEAALAGGATVGGQRLKLSWPTTPAGSVAAAAETDSTPSAQTEVDVDRHPAEAAEEPHASLSDYEDGGEDADDEDERSWRP